MSEPERQPTDATPDKPAADRYVVVQPYSLDGLKRPVSEVCIYIIYIAVTVQLQIVDKTNMS